MSCRTSSGDTLLEGKSKILKMDCRPLFQEDRRCGVILIEGAVGKIVL